MVVGSAESEAIFMIQKVWTQCTPNKLYILEKSNYNESKSAAQQS